MHLEEVVYGSGRGNENLWIAHAKLGIWGREPHAAPARRKGTALNTKGAGHIGGRPYQSTADAQSDKVP